MRLFVRRVHGNSMAPFVKGGDAVLASARRSYKTGSVVLARLPKHETIKRIKRVGKNTVWLAGDNAEDSFDSREYGAVPKSVIMGVVMARFTLPKATAPLAFRWPGLRWLCIGLAAVYAVLVMVQLAGFEGFAAGLQGLLGLNDRMAIILALKLAAIEILALPVLLWFWLSPLMRAVSQVCVLLAPFLWLGFLAIGQPVANTGLLGDFFKLTHPLSWLLVTAWALLALVVTVGLTPAKPEAKLKAKSTQRR